MGDSGGHEPAYRSHTNQERMVKCPYCDEVVFARGLHMHVLNSGDEEHGGFRELPDDFEEQKEDLEEVGQRSLTMVVPTQKEYDQELAMCKWCGETFKGTHGLGTHLGRVDDANHPTDSDVRDAGIRIPANEDHEPVWSAELEDQLADEVEFNTEELPERVSFSNPPSNFDATGEIPASKVLELAQEFEKNEAKDEPASWKLAAERVRALVERES